VAESIAVLGSGGWGTTLAVMLDEIGHDCRLWVRNPDESTEIERRRENARFLPGIPLSNSLRITADPAVALAGAGLVLIAVPMESLVANLRIFKPLLPENAVVVSAVKGIAVETGQRVSEVAAGILEPVVLERWVTLSGPNIGREVAVREPTTTVIAGPDRAVTERVQKAFSAAWFRAYTSDDLVGVELAGALKNIVAIGAGMTDGMHLGHNAKAALMTRGLAEMTRLGIAAGANALTFGGLAGVGDLIATCESPQSRNHYVGEQLALGCSLDEITGHMDTVAEGIGTTRGAGVLAKRLGVDMPITETMRAVLFAGLPVAEGMERLMSREPVHELRGLDPEPRDG
jgi:glycerol-3-phosphate dehydrogenase (NAD(P)+)